MGENFVKNFVMGAEIDPKLEMDLSMFEIVGWKILQLSNRKLSEFFFEEAATVALPKQRFIPRNAQREGVDVTTWRSSWDGAMFHATTISSQ